ncbi:hypothetical protein [Bartonella tribocorum]|uniref:Uncharacterized protein n=1 Tax=Bartonella tribocorum TaxID=85701 RepID=A0A2N9Y8X4_9HYPH|nr:hypothetical protein [Bartonella tribocorum]PIT68157.1 hypothetical protein CER18_08065 [Bartonella tribocorum]
MFYPIIYIIIVIFARENKFEKLNAVVYGLLAYKVSGISAQNITVLMEAIFYKIALESQVLGQK